MLSDLLACRSKLLAECAVAERLRRQPGVSLHPTLFNTPLIYGPEEAKQAMSALYTEYLEVAEEASLPLILTAPTWRLDAGRISEAGACPSINRDAVAYLIELRDRFKGERKGEAPVGALVGPKNDCYRPDLSPDADAAEVFHQPQIEELAATPADFLLAQTLPAVDEAIGIARAMAASGTPYLISFCIDPSGRVLDGTPLPQAMEAIDRAVAPSAPPLGFFVNCTHPRFLLDRHEPGELERLVGIQANGSSRDVTRLDGSAATVADPLPTWASAMLELHQDHAVKILGGCCGTGLAHLKALAEGPGSLPIDRR